MTHDINLEKILLGTFLSEKDAYQDHAHLLFSELWYQDGHRVIYEVIKSLSLKNAPIDIVSGATELKKRGELDYIGGAGYLSDITNDIFLPESLEYHIRVLTQYYFKRELFIFGQKVSKNANDITSDVFEQFNEIENKLADLNSKIIGNEVQTDLKSSIERTYIHLMTPRESGCTGIKTGNGELTDILGGFNPEFILLCGRPSMGKTSRMLQFAMEVAEQGKPVAIFSVEMVQEHQLNTKLINYVSQVESNLINSQSCNEEERGRIAWAKEHISKLPIHVYDKSHVSPNYIRTICRQLQRQDGLGMIFIDFLQLLKSNEFIKGRNRDLEIGDISSSLKAISKDLRVPVMALSQLSRQCEERADKRPQLRDLRESGNLEQDADVIMSVYRPYYYDPSNPEQEYSHLSESQYEMVCELGIMKHRMGGAQKIITEYFDKPKSKFNTKL